MQAHESVPPIGREPGDALCTGLCQGERSSIEGPAQLLMNASGKRIMWCPCCSTPLKVVPMDWGTGAPNIRNDLITSKQIRFECVHCKYDTVLLSEIKPA